MTQERDPRTLSKLLYFNFKDNDFGEFIKYHLIEHVNAEMNDILDKEYAYQSTFSEEVRALAREAIYKNYELYLKKCLLPYKRYVDHTTPNFKPPHFYYLYKDESWIYEMGWLLLNRKNKQNIESHPEVRNAYKYLMYAWIHLRRHKRHHMNFKAMYPELILLHHGELHFFYNTIDTPKFKHAILDFITIIQHENEYGNQPFNKRKWNRIISELLKYSNEITNVIVVEIPFTYFGMDIKKDFIQKDERLYNIFFGDIERNEGLALPAQEITDTVRVQLIYIFRSRKLREYMEGLENGTKRHHTKL